MSPTTANMAIPQAVTAERKAASAKTLSPVLIRGLSGLATGSALASLDPAVPASALFSGVGLAGVRFLGSAGMAGSSQNIGQWWLKGTGRGHPDPARPPLAPVS